MIGTIYAVVYGMVHTWIVNGLADMGLSLLERTMRQRREDEKGIFHFPLIMHRLSKKGCKDAVIQQMQVELMEDIQKDPLLEEFRKREDSVITFERDPHGRCLVKEDQQPILTCSRESRLGKLGLAYWHLQHLKEPSPNEEKIYEKVA